MVLSKLPVPGRPTIWITVRQGPTALAVGARGGYLDIFTLVYPFFPLSPTLWETGRYRLKYCLKGPLNPKPTKQKSICTLRGLVGCFGLNGPLIGWLVVGFNGPLRQNFSLYRTVSQREGERGEKG